MFPSPNLKATRIPGDSANSPLTWSAMLTRIVYESVSIPLLSPRCTRTTGRVPFPSREQLASIKRKRATPIMLICGLYKRFIPTTPSLPRAWAKTLHLHALGFSKLGLYLSIFVSSHWSSIKYDQNLGIPSPTFERLVSSGLNFALKKRNKEGDTTPPISEKGLVDLRK